MIETKKTRMVQIGDLEPECPKCRGSNAMLHETRMAYPPKHDAHFTVNPTVEHLTCRDCRFSINEKDVEIEKITMVEAQDRLRKYGGLFILKG